MENGGQRGARVFHVRVDVAVQQGAVANQRATEIHASLDGNSFPFDRLRHDFAENQLLGEVLRADHHGAMRAAGGGAARNQDNHHDGGRRAERRADRSGAAPSRELTLQPE